MTPTARLRREIDHAAAELAEAGVGSPRADAEELAAYAAGTSRGRLSVLGEIDDDFCSRYADLVAARARRIPLQHIVGSAALGPVTVAVGPGVFIPRPETEGLLEWASAQPLPPQPVLVDLCTGTGALALALSKFWPDARIIAVDDSDEALDYALRNVAGSAVELVRADVTDNTCCRNWMGRSTCWSPIRPTSPTVQRWNPKSRSMIRRMHCSVARTGWWSSMQSPSWRAAGSSPVAGVPSSMTTPRRRPPSKRSPRRAGSST